jgi:Carboxypeptidase regulatory-like domain/TonB dependent receptor
MRAAIAMWLGFTAGLIFSNCLWGQVSTGSLSGEVREVGAAAVAGVTVAARDEGTGFIRRSVSSTEGSYRMDELSPGSYTITATRQGYRTLSISHITVEVNEQARLDLELTPGQQRDVVTVTAHVSEVQAEEPSIGYRLDSPVVSELPLDQRNVASLITLGPGAIPRQLGGFTHDQDNDEQAGSRGSVALNPPVNGGRPYMNTQLLDGAGNTDRNTFAIVIVPPLDSVREFRIQSSLASAAFAQAGGGVSDIVTKAGGQTLHGSLFEFLQNEATDARNFFDNPALPRSIVRLNQFGGSLGGAVPIVPSTFFFVAYEGLVGKAGKPSAQTVPTQTVRSGDFSGGATIFDPLSLNADGSRAAFAGNTIPQSLIDPIAKTYLAEFEPLPNIPPTSTGNYIDTTPSTNNNQTVSARIDHDMKKAGQLFGRYTINNEDGGIGGNFPLRPTSEDVRAQQVAIGHSLAGASWQNEARASFTRLRVFDVPLSAFHENTAKELGLVNAPTDPAAWGLPYFLIDNYATVTDDPTLPQTQRDNTWSVGDSISMVRGRHALRMGGEWSAFQMDYVQSQSVRGQYEYTGAFTGNGTPGTGDPLADFLLGYPQNTQRTVGSALAHLRQSIYAAFFQDDWKLRPSLTINLGVRYEYASPYRDARGQMLNVNYSQNPPALVPISEASQPRAANFAPRVGLAWRLPPGLMGPGEMVFRAGYGIYFVPEIAAESYDLVLNGITTQINTTDGTQKPILTTLNGFPQTSTTGFPSYYGLDKNAASPYVQQWNAGFQKELPGRMLFEASYVGSKGTHLGRFDRENIPPEPEPGPLQLLRPFPTLGTIFQRKHIANSSYNSLQLKVEKRFTNSLSFVASYVWSKSIDDADSILAGSFEGAGAQDENNLRLERGLSFSNVPRRLSAGFVYNIPAVQRLKSLTGGWQLSGVITLQDGTPLNPFYFGADYSNTGTPNRPNLVPGQVLNAPVGGQTVAHWFNTAAFSTPAPYTYGDAGRDILPGPGNEVVDLALHRRFAIRERLSLELRAEAFNSLNHPNYGIPGPYPDFTSIFGVILSTGTPRHLQFGARLDF